MAITDRIELNPQVMLGDVDDLPLAIALGQAQVLQVLGRRRAGHRDVTRDFEHIHGDLSALGTPGD